VRTEDILIERYGPLLTVEQLADLLQREPQSLRNALRLETNALAPLARMRRRIGRRMYFEAGDVADFISRQSQ